MPNDFITIHTCIVNFHFNLHSLVFLVPLINNLLLRRHRPVVEIPRKGRLVVPRHRRLELILTFNGKARTLSHRQVVGVELRFNPLVVVVHMVVGIN